MIEWFAFEARRLYEPTTNLSRSAGGGVPILILAGLFRSRYFCGPNAVIFLKRTDFSMETASPRLLACCGRLAMSMFCGACTLLLAAACVFPRSEARPGSSPPPPSSSAEQPTEPALEADPQFLKLVKQADAVVVGQLVRADFSAEDRDGFLTTADWNVLESVRGPQVPGNAVRVRFPLGQKADGDWSWIAHEPAISPNENARMKPGDTFLLMLSRATYEEQARARGGQPLPDVTGAGLGFHRIKRREILASGGFRPPSTIDALKAALEEQ